MLIFRFTSFDGGTIRLDLNDPAGWMLARGFELGTRRLERTYIAQPPYAGAVLATSYAPPVKMIVPLLLQQQASVAAVRTKLTQLQTELLRETNTIEMREPNDTASFFIDTFKADVPSIHHAVDAPNQFLFRATISPIVVEFDRLPDLRGAGAMV